MTTESKDKQNSSPFSAICQLACPNSINCGGIMEATSDNLSVFICPSCGITTTKSNYREQVLKLLKLLDEGQLKKSTEKDFT